MYIAFGALILLKLFFTYKFPVLSDEAYYVFWGTHPDGGYYDLPPMIGWWESLVTKFSLHPFWIRLPNLLVTSLVSFGIYDVMKRFGKKRAQWVALLYFALPLHFLGVIISPDVPLIFFSFCAVVLFFFSDQKLLHYSTSSEIWSGRAGYFFSGALWGAAFLSKYFALMLVPGIIAWVLTSRKNSQSRALGLLQLLWVAVGAFPFLFQHVYWNSKNCMANFVFNLISRQAASDGSIFQTFGFFVIYLLIIVSPVLLRDLFKATKTELRIEGAERGFSHFQQEHEFRNFIFLMWAIPILFFGLTALVGKGQGIHWYLSYTPFFLIWISFKLSEADLRIRVARMFALSGSLAVVVAALLLFPRFLTEKVLNHRFQLDIEMAMQGEQLASQLAPLVKSADAVVSNGYVFSSVLDMQLRRYGIIQDRSVVMWGGGSRFGRVFDWTADFRALHGKDIILFSGNPVPSSEFGDFFFNSKTEKFSLNDTDYYVMTGSGFKSEEYIERVLVPAIHQQYPSFPFVQKCPVRDKIL